MSSKTLLSAFVVMIMGISAANASIVSNGGFENGMTDWTVSGTPTFGTEPPGHSGTA